MAVVVADTEAALGYFRDRLGLEVVAVDVPPEVPVRLTYLDLGNTYLQLVEPLDPDHPLAAWLAGERRRPAPHLLRRGRRRGRARAARSARVPLLPLGSGRGRPAGFLAGDPPHGVRIECTTYEPKD